MHIVRSFRMPFALMLSFSWGCLLTYHMHHSACISFSPMSLPPLLFKLCTPSILPGWLSKVISQLVAGSRHVSSSHGHWYRAIKCNTVLAAGRFLAHCSTLQLISQYEALQLDELQKLWQQESFLECAFGNEELGIACNAPRNRAGNRCYTLF